MKLSILIPVVRERPGPVIDKLMAQAEERPEVEILWFGDNRRRSIGLKRQALLDIARGERIAFVDDDDDVADDYLAQLLPLCAAFAPVITFDAIVRYDAPDWSDCYVECAVANVNEEAAPGERIKRAAWHIHAWWRCVARQATFPDLAWGEDWAWAKLLQPREPCPRIPAPLYFYRERTS